METTLERAITVVIRVLIAEDEAMVRGADGITAAAELSRELPGTRTPILTTFGRPGSLRRAALPLRGHGAKLPEQRHAQAGARNRLDAVRIEDEKG